MISSDWDPKDIIGKRFGRLVVQRMIKKRVKDNGRRYDYTVGR